MLQTIENEQLICTIESNGAEIRSLKNKENGEEYIWQINKAIWGSSSPVLFPAIGKTKNNKVVFEGNEFAMPKHGIVRNNSHLSFTQNDLSKCAFVLKSSKETLKQYPYNFLFTVAYELVENRLIMTYTVENREAIPIQFACGGHTAYACKTNENSKLSDYVLDFPKPLQLLSGTLGANGLLSRTQRKIECKNGILPLSETLFNEDALIFENVDFGWVRLRKKENKKGLIVRFEDYPNLALWSKPGADFICIEPWLGLPDFEEEAIDITQKSSLRTLQANEKFSIAIESEIE